MLNAQPKKLSLAQLPTPIRKLSRLSAVLGGADIWIKQDYLSGFQLSGNKVRKLEYLLADALAKCATHIITCGGVQSNHCRATAFACAQLGLKCTLILRDDLSSSGHSSIGEANYLLDFLAGARIELYPADEYRRDLDNIVDRTRREIEQQGGRAYAIPVGGSNGLGLWAYIDCAAEIKLQCSQAGFTPDVIACASGSGGTQAGLSLGVHLHDMEAQVNAFAVCDSADYFFNKVRSDVRECSELVGQNRADTERLISALRINTNDEYLGPGYAKADAEVYGFIRQLASLEGELFDPVYTGKAFYGLTKEIKRGRYKHCKNILFVHTGGGFGIFPHAELFRAAQDLDAQTFA